MKGQVSEELEVLTGVGQGRVLPPIVFNCYVDIMRKATESMGDISYDVSKGPYQDGVEGSATLQDVMYADDLVLVAEQRQNLQRLLTAVDMAWKKRGIEISVEKPICQQWHVRMYVNSAICTTGPKKGLNPSPTWEAVLTSQEVSAQR